MREQPVSELDSTHERQDDRAGGAKADDTGSDRPEPGQTPAQHPAKVDRGTLILQGLRGAAAWSWRFLLVIAALAVTFYLIGKAWVGVLPLLMALLVATVLWQAVRWLKDKGVPAALASIMVLLVSILAVVGALVAVAPSMVEQGGIIVRQAGEGLQVVLDWVAGPPLNLQNEQVTEYVDQATAWLQERASQIAAGVLTGVSTVGSVLVTLALSLVLTFFSVACTWLLIGAEFLGVALVPEVLVEPEITAGRLIMASERRLVVSAPYSLIFPAHSLEIEAFVAFRDWLAGFGVPTEGSIPSA